MIKTLRITSFLAAIAAVFLLASPFYFSGKGNTEVKKLLNSPDLVERFNSRENSSNALDGQETALVQQAQIFASILNPPVVRAAPRQQNSRTASPVTPPPDVTPKFSVLATVYCQNNPSLSQAFINEPGSGSKWVKQSGTVGHFTIEVIKDGSIIVRNGQETYEIHKETNSAASKAVTPTPANNNTTATQRITVNTTTPAALTPNRLAGDIRPPANQNTETLRESDLALIEKLQELMGSPASSDKTDNNPSEKEKVEMMQKLLSGSNASQVNKEEEEIIDDLGKAIDNSQNKSSENADAMQGK